MTSLNIVDLITNNPITRLTETHNNNLLNKVKIILMKHSNSYL